MLFYKSWFSSRHRTVAVYGAALCGWWGLGNIAAAAAPSDPAELARAHAAAGEFGPALQVAGNVPDGPVRQKLLTEIADVQRQAGEVGAAQATAGRIDSPRVRAAARGANAARESLQGGIAADFQPLIDLIVAETTGPWDSVEPGTSPDPQEFESGVRVDPHGVLTRLSKEEHGQRLQALGVQARKADLNADLAEATPLRLVSLTRLEAEVAKRIADGQPIAEAMKHLAGLSSIQYVFAYPDDREIIIAGPAEGWRYDGQGQPLGLESGKPTLQLDDLVNVLRTFGPGGQGIFGCSIDPRAEGLKSVQELVAQNNKRGALTPAGVRSYVNKLGQTLGMQNITVYGVPADSRVARVIVEADYRMKLIGIGKMDGGPHVPDYFELLSKDTSLASSSMDALRWWMTMKYDEVLHSANHEVFEIRGSAVVCQSENQFLTASGQRLNTGKSEPVNLSFAANFTKHFAELAAQDPVFADMNGVFDLALVAALIRHEGLDQRLAWNRGVFAVDGAYQPRTFDAPRECESVVNHKVYNGKDVVIQVAGGVRADLAGVLKSGKTLKEETRLNTRPKAQLPEGRWWWDAE